MKGSDITDLEFLTAMHQVGMARGRLSIVTRWDLMLALDGHPELLDQISASDVINYRCDIPPKVLLSKAQKLIRRGLIEGCTCGCHGSFEFTSKGEGLLREVGIDVREAHRPRKPAPGTTYTEWV